MLDWIEQLAYQDLSSVDTLAPIMSERSFNEDVDGASRVDWLVDIIGGEIVSGALTAGAKISEPRLAQRFGVSRAPVREAIRRLEERRLVIRRPNTGVRVASFTPQDFVDLLHLREGLEGIAARLAAERMSASQVDDLRALCGRYEAAEGDEPAMLRADLDFHFLIAQASGNAMLAAMLCDDFYAFFQIWRRRYPRLPGREGVVQRQHRAIVDAIEARDSELAEFLDATSCADIESSLPSRCRCAERNLEDLSRLT